MQTQILLFGDDAARAQDWLKFNASWYDAANDDLAIVQKKGGDLELFRPTNVAEALDFGTPIEFGPSVAFEDGTLASDGGGRDLVLAPFSSAVQSGWRETIAQAGRLENVLAATGRWIVAPKGLAISPDIATVEYVDAMPQRIAPYVLDWSFSPQMHGLRLSELPLGFIWISPAEARRFVTAISFCQDVQKGVQLYFQNAAGADGMSVYLPDLMVYDSK